MVVGGSYLYSYRISTTLVVQVEQSVRRVCLCFWVSGPITFCHLC